NTGTAAGSTSYSIVISNNTTINLFDTEVYSGTTPSISAGGSDATAVTCTVPTTTPNGQYYVGIYIDATTTACTANPDVTVSKPSSPPPPERDGGSCGCSPVSGYAPVQNVLGMLLPYLLGVAAVLLSRRRRNT
ncbi:MAG: hypothetical protein ACYS47_14235, partial [Planctomycetota bacterium]